MDQPCEFCQLRNITVCVKTRNEKTNEIMSSMPLTPNGVVISAKDGALLQFAYSDEFVSVGGAFMGNLFRKFARLFGTSIESESLRQTTLAWSAALMAPKLSFLDQMQEHSIAARRALKSKSCRNTLDTADLYACLLLAYLSCFCQETCTFKIRIVEAMDLIQNDNIIQSARNHDGLSVFLPLARDLILEGGRALRQTNELMLQFFNVFQRAIGSPDFDHRMQYCQELVDVREHQLYTFYHSIWHHTTILRRCLRDTVSRQFTDIGRSADVQSVLTGVTNDLQSEKVQVVVAQLSVLKSIPAFEDGLPDIAHDEWMFALLLYHFCRLMTTLLESETLVDGVSSIAAVSRASGLLQFVNHIWLQDDPCLPCNLGVPSNLRKAVVVRILLLIGLTMNLDQFSHG